MIKCTMCGVYFSENNKAKNSLRCPECRKKLWQDRKRTMTEEEREKRKRYDRTRYNESRRRKRPRQTKKRKGVTCRDCTNFSWCFRSTDINTFSSNLAATCIKFKQIQVTKKSLNND